MTLPDVIFRAPRVGLANMLITWARAVVYAEQNGLTLGSYGWSAFRPGPWLRRESRKRLYQNMFRPNMSWSQMLFAESLIRKGRAVVFDPDPNGGAVDAPHCVFRGIPQGPDFFSGLQQHSGLITAKLHELLTETVRQTADKQPAIQIACHIRRGDFIAPDDHRYTPGGRYCQTPTGFYGDAIRAIRNKVGECLPVTIFTNGRPNEVAELLQMPRVSLACQNSDLVDLLRMSKAEFLMTSAWSSYSYLAGYLGDSTLIRFSYPEMQPVRDDTSSGTESTLDRFLQLPMQKRAA